MGQLLVCGLGRCGTSLVMQMLNAGGFPVIGGYPAFEDNRFDLDRNLSQLLPQIGNVAVKIIDPHHSIWPEALECKCIWMDRDIKQQAKSQVKFVSLLVGFAVPSRAWKSIAKSLPKEREACLQILKRMPMLRLRFEDVLARPIESSRTIQSFVGVELDIDAMVSVVLPRKSDCQKNLDIEMQLCTVHRLNKAGIINKNGGKIYLKKL